jgi:hypothetical protein
MITTQSLAHDLADQNDHDWLLRDDLGRVEVPARAIAVKRPSIMDAGRRDVLLEPGGMLGTNRVVVR